MTLELQGRVALVTGASRGIGYAIAEALKGHGAQVAALARDKDALDAAVTRLAGNAESVLAVPADVTDAASVREAVATAHAWGGRLDIVVNCAGPQLTPSPLADTPDHVLTSYLDVKLAGFHRVASAALPLISDTGTGRIINIAGQTARTLVPNAGVTGITNAAVIALTSYLASEGAARHVLVNAISPGMTLTEGWISPARRDGGPAGHHRRGGPRRHDQGRRHPAWPLGRSQRDRAGRRLPGIRPLVLHHRPGDRGRRRAYQVRHLTTGHLITGRRRRIV